MSNASTFGGEQADYVSTKVKINDAVSPSPDATMNQNSAEHGQATRSSVVFSSSQGGWWVAEALFRRWRWLAAGGGILAALGLLAGLMLWEKQFSVSAQLIRYESPNSQEVFGFRQATPQTLAGVLRAPELLRRVARLAQPALTTDQLEENLRVTPDRNSELLTVTLFGRDAETLVGQVNLYAREAVRFTGESQAKMAVEVRDYQKQQLVQIENEITKLNDQLLAMPRSVLKAAPSRPAPLLEKLQAERDELVVLLARYTEVHPFVKEQRAKVAAIEKQLAELRAPATVVAQTNSEGGNDRLDKAADKALSITGAMTDIEIIRSKLQSLENARLQVLGRERAAQLLVENPPGHFRVFSEAAIGGVVAHNTGLKVVFFAIFSGLTGVFLVAAWIAWLELVEDRLLMPHDVQRVTSLPLLASLGDLKSMSGAERERWAFRTWTALQSRLSLSPNHGLVCGVTSVEHGAGRSTWIKLLAEAASQCGFRVLTIATQPSPSQIDLDNGLQASEENRENIESKLVSLSANVLASPAEVTEKLVGPNSQPLVHIPLPGWVWNLDRRKEWKTALADWGKIENIVILVELPPASVPEAVLLGENLPNLIWLADAGKTSAARTRRELETLRYARCNLVGAVLNHKSASPLENLFPRWLSGLDGVPA